MVIRNIEVVRSGTTDWASRFAEQLESRNNFVFVADTESELWELFQLQTNQVGYSPDLLRRWGIYSLNDVLEPQEREKLLEEHAQGRVISLVEQLRLPHSRPPAVKPIIVYCEPRGIISQHEDMESANRSLRSYIALYTRALNFPLAGVHEWQGEQWSKVRCLGFVY